MLSEKIFKTSLGVALTAGALGFGLFVGSAGPSRAQDKAATPATPAQPQAQDAKEYSEAAAALKETDPKKKLALLDTWKKDYPTTPLASNRHDMYLTAYMGAQMARETFDEALEILNKDNPAEKDKLIPMVYAIQVLPSIKPAPTPQDLDNGEKVAWEILNDAALFAPANKPAGQTDAAWAQTKAQVQTLAKGRLLVIAAARKDDKREAEEITKLINYDPNFAPAAYQLGTVMQKMIKESGKLEEQPMMFWQFGRAITDAGPNALPPANQKQVSDFLTKAYQTYHGSTDGLQDFIAQTKTAPFPPAGFTLKSTVDIAKDQAAADAAEQAKDPVYYLWVHQLKEPLLKDDSLFASSVKDAQIPPPDANGMPQFFKAHIISMTPANRPKEILVGVEKANVADAKLTFETALPGKMEPGEVIQFTGAPTEFQKDPFMLTFAIDDYKKELNGTWTGKNAPPARSGVKGKSTK